MGYFPFFVDIGAKNGVIVGGGRVAAGKVEKLAAFGPHLTVIAPCIEECMRKQEELLQNNETASLFFCERKFRTEDLDGADFVIAATDDALLNGRISEYCTERKIPVNVADDREKCSFLFPALVREKSLTIGISTEGKSPLTASRVKEEICRILPSGIGDIIDLMGQIRPHVMALKVEEPVRKKILENLFLYCSERAGNVTIEELLDQIRGYAEESI